MRKIAMAALVLVAGNAMPAAAEEEKAQYVEGELELTLGNDNVVSSDDPGNEINDLFPEAALGLRVGLLPGLSLNAGLTLEPVLDPLPFEDRFFGDVGLYLDTLNLEAEIGDLTFVAGKFGPGFGRAWDNTPGIYGTDFAEDYELSEQIGFGAAYSVATPAAGTHTLGANIFFADTTVFSDSIFTRRGRLSTADGGAGNTGRLDNFSVTLDGAEFPSLPGFSYHLGYRHLSAGLGDLGSENGFVAGVAQEAKLASGLLLAFTGEVAHFDNFGGTLDSATYFTPGLALGGEHWHGELSGTVRRINFDVGGGQTDLLAQASVGYTFDNGIDLSAGYAFVRAENIRSHVVGVRLSKTFEFSTR